ncbi:hypothetical protein HDU98_002434, partial [Podochytrium sp. JEL0797]
MHDVTSDESSLSPADDAFPENNDPAEFPFGAPLGPLLDPNIDVDPAAVTESELESDASESETETETDHSAGDDGSDSEWEEEDAGDSSDSDNEPWEGDFQPFASKLVATVFILLFGCRRRMSILQMRVLWSIFRMLNVMSQLPSLNTVLSMRKKIGGITPVRRTTSSGAEVFVRPAPEIVKRAFSDELLSARVQREPKPSPNPKEIYETPAYSQLAPKLCGFWGGHVRFYEGDVVRLANGNLYEICHFEPAQMGVVLLDLRTRQRVISRLLAVAPVLVNRGDLSLRANGVDVVNFPLGMSTDEVSGNRSKRYNHFESVFFFFFAFARKFRTPAYAFFAASVKANWRDVLEAVLVDFQPDSELTRGMRVFDVHSQEDILVVCRIYSVLADNPRHYNVGGLAGSSANFYCRFCLARKGEMAIAEPRTLGHTFQAHADMAAVSTKCGKERVRVATGVRIPDPGLENPCLHLVDFNPYWQTNIDVLHTLLIGVIKHAARVEKKIYNRKSPNIAMRALQARVGPLFSSVCSYHGPHSVTPHQFQHNVGSMYAKDFKQIVQVGPFLYPWFSWDRRWVWIGLAALAKISYDTHYQSRDAQARLIEKAASLVQALFQYHLDGDDNSPKLHLLAHLAAQFLFFGPLPLYSVEVSEHMNGTVRHALCVSNRQHASRDLGDYFATVERVAEMMRGAVDVGDGLKEMRSDPILRRVFKLDEPKDVVKRVGEGEFVFYDGWTEIGRVLKCLDGHEFEMERLERLGSNWWGACTYSLSGVV